VLYLYNPLSGRVVGCEIVPYTIVPTSRASNTCNFNPVYQSTTTGYKQTNSGDRVACNAINLKPIFIGFLQVLLIIFKPSLLKIFNAMMQTTERAAYIASLTICMGLGVFKNIQRRIFLTIWVSIGGNGELT
jgi:hypothetical protein